GYVLKDALEVANRPSTYLPNFIIRQGDRSNKRGYSSILCAGKAWVFSVSALLLLFFISSLTIFTILLADFAVLKLLLLLLFNLVIQMI
ncbi:MAG: hypothetical protein IJ062_10285, partial [Firmicutes bacterium]|nr:hypothetical protein [Bacillota bacterium]